MKSETIPYEPTPSPAVAPTSDGPEIGLDPEHWSAVQELLHRAVDDSIAYLRTVGERPVWQQMPESVRSQIDTPAPWEGVGLASTYDDFRELIQPYALGNIHGRFWGWVPGSGTAGGLLAELLKATINTVPAAFDECGRLLEQQVVAWMLEAFGMPKQGSGILVSGGSMANFVGLAVARDAMAGFDVRAHGVRGAESDLVLYASTATHNSVDKAVQVLGLGRAALRKIPVDTRHRIELAALREAIARDRADGHLPFAVVGNAGTVDTGASDDLSAIADLCAAEQLWLHVDGAFGAIAALSPTLRPQIAGMERADSLAFDFHKWLHVQYSAGCTLFRDEAAHRGAFTVPAPYLAGIERGPAAQASPSHQLGPELSREAKALKIWMSLREHGLAVFGELAEQNVEQARYLASLVTAAEQLELVLPPELNIVCFRYRPEDRRGWTGDACDRINQELLMRLQEQGIAVPSHTTLGGRFAIRVCITSHRSRRSDFRLLVAESIRLGSAIEAEHQGATVTTA